VLTALRHHACASGGPACYPLRPISHWRAPGVWAVEQTQAHGPLGVMQCMDSHVAVPQTHTPV
jgi:hypothetical protein